MRLAIVSPLPPAATGIADYTIDVANALKGSHEVELFHSQTDVARSLPVPAFRIGEILTRPAHDAVIYQMGNAPAHDFIYEWMSRIPGVVVLHDLVLHHSYARRHLESPESIAYAADPSSDEKRRRAEAGHSKYETAIEAVYPGRGERLKDAWFNTTGDLLPYAFPLFEPALEGARAVGAHNDFMVEALQDARPDLPSIRLTMPVEAVEVSDAAISAFRSRHGLSPADAVIGCFGLITREKRIETVARALARISEIHPKVRLLLAGGVNDSAWLEALLARNGVAARTIVAGRLAENDFAAAIAISDAVVHLRHPTARETSAALLRVMAHGRPVVISDIANQAEIPNDTVRRVDLADEEGDLSRAIDWVLRHREAARRMGERARRFTLTEHSPSRTLSSYERLLNCAAPLYSRPHA